MNRPGVTPLHCAPVRLNGAARIMSEKSAQALSDLCAMAFRIFLSLVKS